MHAWTYVRIYTADCACLFYDDASWSVVDEHWRTNRLGYFFCSSTITSTIVDYSIRDSGASTGFGLPEFATIDGDVPIFLKDEDVLVLSFSMDLILPQDCAGASVYDEIAITLESDIAVGGQATSVGRPNGLAKVIQHQVAVILHDELVAFPAQEFPGLECFPGVEYGVSFAAKRNHNKQQEDQQGTI